MNLDHHRIERLYVGSPQTANSIRAMATLGTSNEKNIPGIDESRRCRDQRVCMTKSDHGQEHHLLYLLKTSEERMRITTSVPTSSQVGGWDLNLPREERRVERKGKHVNQIKSRMTPACTAVPSLAVVKRLDQRADAGTSYAATSISYVSPFNPGATINPRPVEATTAQTTMIKPRRLIQANAGGKQLVV